MQCYSNLTAIYRKRENAITGSIKVDIVGPEESAISFSGVQLEGWIDGALKSTIDTVQTILRAPVTPLCPRLFSFLILAEELGKQI